jgi:hypothetical protein
MLSYLDMHDFATGMADHKEDIERSEENRLHADEVASPDFASVLFEKMRHPGDGFCPCGRRMYLATVRAETLCPSLACSAWILRWPNKAEGEFHT